MTTPDDQTDDPDTNAAPIGDPNRTSPPLDLVSAARQPEVDVCDVACEAMPAHLANDLSPAETDWLLGHTGGCRWCANELDRYDRVGGALDRIHADRFDPPPPNPPPLGRGRWAAWTRLESPLGPLHLAASEAGVCEIGFAEHETDAVFRRRLIGRGFDPRPMAVGDDPAADQTLGAAAHQLGEYFAGRRDRFDLPLDFSGVSPFARSVLEATTGVPFGRLDTYRGIAVQVGKPGATRAVGNALGRNPIPVVVPCHRIVRSDHSLGGYTGGPHIKQHLLALEGVTLA